MAVLSQDLVLSKEHTVDTSHQTSSLTVQVRVDFSLEGGLVNVTRSNGNSQSNGLLLGLTSNVVPDGVRRVDTSALLEKRSHSSTRTLRSSQDHVNVGWWHNVGQLLEDRRESVGEIQGLSLGEQRLDGRPGLGLSSVRKQVHDDGSLLDGLSDVKQVLTWNPSVLNGSLPRSTILSDTNDDVQTVVSQIQTLAVTLGTVTDQSKSIVLEVLKQLLSWPVSSLVDNLLDTTKVDLLDTSDTRNLGSGQGWSDRSGGTRESSSRYSGSSSGACGSGYSGNVHIDDELESIG
ncbi:hypothetical protein OGATHE_005044 [Ogataea polymorpha]|uniref:Uncharacterized protein n=1 Tax=Ogataea polymorpha TaxID=460523 RepID=A0A9P8NWG3_9ASCO|nr:hypothetical protein OGATHE_005044 [Ogataea polymorpha]